MTPEMQEVLQLTQALETVIYRLAERGAADVVTQLGEHLRLMHQQLAEVLPPEVLVERAGGATLTMRLELAPRDQRAAQEVMELLSALLTTATQRGLLR